MVCIEVFADLKKGKDQQEERNGTGICLSLLRIKS